MNNKYYAKMLKNSDNKPDTAKQIYAMLINELDAERKKLAVKSDSIFFEMLAKYNHKWNLINRITGRVLLPNGFIVAFVSHFPEIKESLLSSGKFSPKIFNKKVASKPKLSK